MKPIFKILFHRKKLALGLVLGSILSSWSCHDTTSRFSADFREKSSENGKNIPNSDLRSQTIDGPMEIEIVSTLDSDPDNDLLFQFPVGESITFTGSATITRYDMQMHSRYLFWSYSRLGEEGEYDFGNPDAQSQRFVSQESLSFAEPGSYVIYLKVITRGNLHATGEQIIEIAGDGEPPPPPPLPPPGDGNEAPMASIFMDGGSAVTISEGQSVFFDGSASQDIDGVITDYRWNINGSLVLSGGNANTYTHTFNLQGTYIVSLTVEDNEGAVSQSNQLTVNVQENNQPPPPPPSGGDSFVVDHRSIASFSQIPSSCIAAARNMPMLFSDRSVGQNISEGLDCLASDSWARSPASCRRDWIGEPGGDRRTFTATDLQQGTVPDRIYFDAEPGKYNRDAWTFEFRMGTWSSLTQNFIEDLLPNYAPTKTVITYQFSYLNVNCSNQATDPECLDIGGSIADPNSGFFQNSANSFDVYDLESALANYPDKTFFYWTTSLARTIGNQVSTTFNEQMRQYAANNQKILFDVADIESHTETGQPCTDAFGNGFPAICQDYTTESGGGHLGSVSAGKIQIAKGFWIVMARLAGWDGVSTNDNFCQ